MSRIFEALRRVEQLNSPSTPSTEETFPGTFGKLPATPFPPEIDGLSDLTRLTGRPHPQSHLLWPGGTDFAAVERFKLLRHRLYELRKQRVVKSVLITSAVPKEGKSMVAANLAITLAQTSDRVLLIDADLRKPSVHGMLGLNPGEGLAEILQGSTELMAACRRIDPVGFCLLSSGRPPANPVELIQGEPMRNMIKTAASTFDWVVIDSPPVVPLADGRFLAALCDAVFLVVREAHTRREELQESLQALKGAPLAGIILNTSRSADFAAYSQYYTAVPSVQGSKRPSIHSGQNHKERASKGGQVS